MGRRNLPGSAALETAPLPVFRGFWLVWGLLLAVVWITFAPVLNNGFVDWDDRQVIVENHAFRGLGWQQVQFAFTTFLGGLYQPLGWLLQSLTHALFGLEPWGYHLVCLLFHALNVLLLHALCVRLVARGMAEAAHRLGRALPWLCAVPVTLYAVHPLRVELVAWASSQAYLPGVTFSLLATLAYLRAHPADRAFRRSWMVAASLLTVLAVLSKGSAVVLPVVFLILDAYPLGRLRPEQRSWHAVRTVFVEKGAIFVFCLAFVAVAFAAKRNRVELEETTGPILVARVAQASFGAWFYLAKTVGPFGITAFYPRPERGEFQTPLFAACIVGVVLAVTAAIRLRRRWPWLAAAVAAYLVIASPYLGLVRVGIPLAADRYSYALLMPWVVVGCAGICKLAQRRWPRPVVLGAGAGALGVVGGLMALCSAQCQVWDSSEHLWAHALEHAPWSSELHDFMGSSLADEWKLDRAIAEFRAALRIRPRYFQATSDMGVALDRRGETDAAVKYLREAARLRPTSARAHLNLGEALVHQGHLDDAVAHYRAGLRLEPAFANLHFNLGVALLRQRRVDEAIDALNRAAKLRPWSGETYTILGGAFVLRGEQDEAAAQYRKALRLDPDHSAARIGLGLALAEQRRTAEAITQLREAVERDRSNPEVHHVLGAILLNSGRVDAAVAEFEETLRLRPDHAKAQAFLAMARGRRM
jgi:tetratricopeptide (TPR) repeat protein